MIEWLLRLSPRAPRARAPWSVRLSAGFAAGLVACSSTSIDPIEKTVTKYDRLVVEHQDEFVAARIALRDGDAPRARASFERLWQAEPDNIVFGMWLQEAEIALIGGAMGTAAAPSATATSTAPGPRVTIPVLLPPEVARRWAELAERAPRPSTLVLAARLETDSARALGWLARAESAAPDCAWIPFARAHRAAQAANWDETRLELGRAQGLDPGNLWVRRLRAWLAARLEGVEQAADEFAEWLDHAQGDPRMFPHLVESALYDLAVLYVLSDEPAKGKAILADLARTTVPEIRRSEAITCAEQALGDWKRALETARFSASIAPDEVLPLVQQALLLDVWMRDREGALKAWERVLAATQGSSDLVDLLQRTRARVRVERLKTEGAAGANRD